MQSRELSKKDYEVLNFLLKYKMLKVEDASLIYKTKRYYRERINNLIYKKYVKRYKSFIVLDKEGRKVLGETGNNYIKNIKNELEMEVKENNNYDYKDLEILTLRTIINKKETKETTIDNLLKSLENFEYEDVDKSSIKKVLYYK